PRPPAPGAADGQPGGEPRGHERDLGEPLEQQMVVLGAQRGDVQQPQHDGPDRARPDVSHRPRNGPLAPARPTTGDWAEGWQRKSPWRRVGERTPTRLPGTPGPQR